MTTDPIKTLVELEAQLQAQYDKNYNVRPLADTLHTILAAIEALKRADVVMVPREAIQQMAERLDSGGRRLETAVKACEEVEAQLRALIDKPKEYQPLFGLTVEEKEHAPHEIRKRTDGYGDPAKGEYNAFLADDGSDIPCD